jgi:hypothetical protein
MRCGERKEVTRALAARIDESDEKTAIRFALMAAVKG